MFIWLTRAELDRRFDELRREYQRANVGWEEWYDKFRRLYARLSKRVSDAQSVDARSDVGAPDATDAGSGESTPPAPPTAQTAVLQAKRRMRGFWWATTAGTTTAQDHAAA